MKRPTLTILLVVDVEKDPRLTRWFFDSLVHWNLRGMDRVQVLVLTQRERDNETLALAAEQPFAVDVVHARHDTVDGYPVWDLCESLRWAWPLVRGRYVTFAHPEFLLCPDRLVRLLSFLRRKRPVLALGNLRRPGGGFNNGKTAVDYREEGRCHSDAITDRLVAGEYSLAAVQAETIPTAHWAYWRPAPVPGWTGWLEDVFFVRRRWFDAVRFWDHCDRQFFQDVYDLVGMACYTLGKFGLAPSCVRLPESVHRAIHLWHPRAWGSWTPAMRDWFLGDPGRWDGTSFHDADLWDHLCDVHDGNGEYGIQRLRRGRNGSVARFARGLEDWLTGGGLDRMARYVESQR